MRILFLSALYPPNTKGGGEISTHYIAQGLRARGHEVEVITSGSRNEQRSVDGVPVRYLKLPLTAKPLFERWHARRMARILQAVIGDPTHYDVIHAHDFRTAQILSELQYRNTIITARDYAQICGSPNNLLADGTVCPGCSLKTILKNRAVVEAPSWRKPFRVWQYRYNIGYRLSSFRAFKQQIFISKAQQKEIARQQDITQTKTHVIYNPVAPAYLRAPLVRSKEKTLLYVGTLESYKGVDILLSAFRTIAQKYPDIHLKLVGEGASQARYQQTIEKWGLQYRISFVGKIPWDRMQHVYDEAWLVVAPHIWIEPFGRTVAEAMARGRLVITANAGGPAEIIQDNTTGFLFQRGSSTDLAKRLEEVFALSHFDQREIEHNAHVWATEHLAVDTIAAQYERAYSEVQA